MAGRSGWVAWLVAGVLTAGCGIDGSLQAGGDGGLAGSQDAPWDVTIHDAPGPEGSTTDAAMPDGSSSGSDTGTVFDSGFPDVGPVCDGGSTLGGACVGAGGCCFPLMCTAAMSCQWACTQNGACTSDSNCCGGSYCGPGGTCTCVPVGGACTSDTQCCSVVTGGGCDHQGDSGRVCGNN